MPVPVAYLRRSRVDADHPGTVSHASQLAAVTRLAVEHGENVGEMVVLEDWGRSGRDVGLGRRTGYADLERMIKAGDVTAVYCYSVSRLARSMATLSRLAMMARDAGVPIRAADGYSPDISSSTGRLILNILGSIHSWQAEWTAERASEQTAARRVAGLRVGPAPYGWRLVDGQLIEDDDESIEVVLDVYLSVSSFEAAARRLTEMGVPTKRGRPWGATTVAAIVRRERPGMVTSGTGAGRRSVGGFRLSGLLVCGCGTRLTGRTFRGRWASYTCRMASVAPNHPWPASISERRVLPEIDRLLKRVRVGSGQRERVEAERARLAVRRQRVDDLYRSPRSRMTVPEYEAEMAPIDDLIAKSDQVLGSFAFELADLEGTPAEVNRKLRRVMEYVTLDVKDGRYVVSDAVWRVPAYVAGGTP